MLFTTCSLSEQVKVINSPNTIYIFRAQSNTIAIIWCVSAVKYVCLCVCVCVFVCLMVRLVFITAAHLGTKAIFHPSSPLTSQVSVSLQCHKYNEVYILAGDCIDSSNGSLKYR